MKAKCPVVVVDDHFELREAICELLLTEGFAVTAVADGKQALKYLRATPDVVVLIDASMVLDKDESVLERLLAERIADRIVVMTTTRAGQRRAQALKLPCLYKPFSLDDLLSEVTALCESLLRGCG